MEHKTTMEIAKDRFVTPTVSFNPKHGFGKFKDYDSVSVGIPVLDNDSTVNLYVAPRGHRFNYPATDKNYPASDYNGQDILFEFDCDDVDGTTITDEAQGLVLTEQGDPTYASSAATAGLGNGLVFDGTGDAFDFALSTTAISAGYDLVETGDFSVEVVFNATNASIGAGDTIVCCRDGAAGLGWQMEFDANQYVDFHVDDGTETVLTGATDCATGSIVHVVASLDRDGNGVLYVNGSVDDTTAITGSTGTLLSESADTRFCIGGDAGRTAGDCFTGTIYFVRVYDKALSATEALENYRVLMNQGSPGWEPLADPADGDDLVIGKSASDPCRFDLTEYLSTKTMAFRAQCATEQTTTPAALDFFWEFSKS